LEDMTCQLWAASIGDSFDDDSAIRRRTPGASAAAAAFLTPHNFPVEANSRHQFNAAKYLNIRLLIMQLSV